MSNTAGDPPYPYQSQYNNSAWYCPKCNAWHCYPNNNFSNCGTYYTLTTDNSNQEIIDLLKKLLDKLEEIRMELP